LKLLSISVAVLVLVGTGGIAYACAGGGGGGGCGKGGHGCPPTVQIVWQNPSSAHSSQTFATCAVALSPSDLTVTVHNLAPGTTCTFSAVLANVGQKAVTLTEVVSILEPHACPQFSYSDNVPHSPARLLPSGNSYSFHGSISLNPSAGNHCQGAFATIVVTITGTESSECDDYPYAVPQLPSSSALWDCD
jgi:hypothetical protein